MEMRGALVAWEMDCGLQTRRIADAKVRDQQTERHSYEKCQYEEFKKRVAKMDELRAAKDGKRSN